MNQTNAALALVGGAPGFFTPRLMAPWFIPAGGAGATSYYETAKLRSTLERLIDFDRINSGSVRFTVGAVNVRSGNLVCFDTQTHRIGPEHVMASGALPPGFPAVEIEGEHYWDGGLVSNTPLEWVVKTSHGRTPWLSRSICGAHGAISLAIWPKWNATEGNHLFEPNPRQHEQLQAHAGDAPCSSRAEHRYARARAQ